MPYDYYDANGYLAPGPTVPQWTQLRETLTGEQGKAMAETGRTDLPRRLADEIESDDAQALQLKAAAERADTFLSLASGTRPETA